MSEEGIATNPKKVEKICNLPAPTDMGGVRRISDLETTTNTNALSKATV